jgi:hypothetical protein
LGLTQRVEYFTIEQFISQATSLTPIWRMTSATSCPCDIKSDRTVKRLRTFCTQWLGVIVARAAAKCGQTAAGVTPDSLI